MRFFDRWLPWRRLAAEAERCRTLVNGAFEALIVHRGGVVVEANPAARRLFGLSNGEPHEAISRWIADVASEAPYPEDDREPVEVTVERRFGPAIPAEIRRRSVRLDGGRVGELLAIRDLTARKESDARMAHLALHDPLTDLANRRFFGEIATRAIAKTRRSGEGFALMVVDLDDFKTVNDTLGHGAGDEVLRATARRIAATLRETDTGARFGGDEFVLLAAELRDTERSLALAHRLMAELAKPVQLADRTVSVTCSIGIAHCPDDGATLEELLHSADVAMYRAKSAGKSTVRFAERGGEPDVNGS